MGSKGNIVRLVQVLTFNRRTIILIIVDKDCNAHRKKTQYKRKIRLFIKKKIFSHIARWGRGRGRNQTIQAKIRHILVRKQLWHFNRQFLRNRLFSILILFEITHMLGLQGQTIDKSQTHFGLKTILAFQQTFSQEHKWSLYTSFNFLSRGQAP